MLTGENTMAKDKKRVEAITSMEEDFTKWYTDICLKRRSWWTTPA